jgi:hypothetical protein
MKPIGIIHLDDDKRQCHFCGKDEYVRYTSEIIIDGEPKEVPVCSVCLKKYLFERHGWKVEERGWRSLIATKGNRLVVYSAFVDITFGLIYFDGALFDIKNKLEVFRQCDGRRGIGLENAGYIVAADHFKLKDLVLYRFKSKFGFGNAGDMDRHIEKMETNYLHTVKEYGDKLAGPIMVSTQKGAYTLYRGMCADLPDELGNLRLKGVHGCLHEGTDGKLHSDYGDSGATRLWVDATETPYSNRLADAIKFLRDKIYEIIDSMPENVGEQKVLRRAAPMWTYVDNFCQIMAEKNMNISECKKYILSKINGEEVQQK